MKLKDLTEGDIVANKMSGNSFIVIRTRPTIVAIRTVEVTNPEEWQFYCKDALYDKWDSFENEII